jgi:LAO/AO transport system kinase
VTSADELELLVTRALAREPAAVARAISLVEDRRASAEPRTIELLRRLAARGHAASCQRVGITGPPGVGKSSLVSVLAREERRRGKSVGVLAVDPSSPRSGGALLGDRARIAVDPGDHDMYVRSMASGGQLGGLARAAGAAVDVLSAVFELVIVETTGVGQSETDVEHVADTVVLVIQPASGDVLQFLKSGILEIPDLFAVNKYDLGALAERTAAELAAALSALHAAARPGDPGAVIHTSATTGAGVSELADAIEAHRAALERAGVFAERRIEKGALWALRLYQQRFGEAGVEAAGGQAALRARLAQAIGRGAAAVEAVAAVRPG